MREIFRRVRTVVIGILGAIVVAFLLVKAFFAALIFYLTHY